MAPATRRVLVVEDEEGIRDLLEAALTANGYSVRSFPNGEEALAADDAQTYDTAIVDIRMPGMNGLEVSRALHERDPDLPVIIVTAHADLDTARDSIRLGAYDYIAKPFDIDDVMISVARATERRALLAENRAYQRDLEARVQERTRQLSDAMRRVELAFQEIQKAHLESIFVLSRVTEINDEYTGNHIRRVSGTCGEVARALGCDDAFVEQITYSSPMHDIGKISVPSELLTKPGHLTDIEMAIIKTHPEAGNDILKKIPFSGPVAEIVLQHHERMDGSGYPGGLVGDDILLEARILAVADVVEAMSSHRPYRPALGREDARSEITEHAGSLYDRKVVSTCKRLFSSKGFAFR